MFVRELTDGQPIERVLLVREREIRRRSDGSRLLKLLLGDRSGTVAAVSADDLPEAEPGACVHVSGRHEIDPVIADAEARDDLEGWKPFEQAPVDPRVSPTRQAADPRPDVGEQRLAITRAREFMDDEQTFDAVQRGGRQSVGNEDLGTHVIRL